MLNKTAFLLILLCVTVSCSDSTLLVETSSDNSARFTLNFYHIDNCGNSQLTSEPSVLVYEQSPLINPMSDFSEYSLGANGELSLNFIQNSLLSFSLLYQGTDQSTNIQTFVELEPGNYDIYLTGMDNESQEECLCESVNAYTYIQTGQLVEEIEQLGMFWGGELETNAFVFNNDLNFVAEICGKQPESAPLAVNIVTSDSRIGYGFIEEATQEKLVYPFEINYLANNLPKPDLGDYYWLKQSAIINGKRYFTFNTAPAKNTYPSFEMLDADSHEFILNKRVDFMFNGILDYGFVYRNIISDSNEFSAVAGLPNIDLFEVNYNDQDNALSWSEQTEVNGDFINLEISIRGSDEKVLNWSIYSKYSTNFVLPLLPENELSIVNNNPIDKLRIQIVDMDNIVNYTGALRAYRLNELYQNKIYSGSSIVGQHTN